MKSLVVSLLILLVAGATTGLMVVFRPPPPSAPPVESVVPVEVRQVQAHEVVFTVNSQGTVQPRTETTLVAEVSGMVTSVSDRLYAGGFFREGEVLLTLDPADYQVAVAQAEAGLLAAQAQLAQEAAQAEQMGREWDLSGRPRSQAPALALRTPFLKEAEARVLSAEADLERSKRQLARTIIRAPYDGLLREKLADVGRYVGTGTQVATLFATDYAEVRLPLSDDDMQWLNLPRPGTRTSAINAAAGPEAGASTFTTQVMLTTDAAAASNGASENQGHQWEGQIVRTEGVVDSSSRMHYAVARIEDPYALSTTAAAGTRAHNEQVLPMGSFVNATLYGIRVPNIFTLPHSAIRNGNQVLIMDQEQRLRQVVVNIVRSDTQSVYINKGLNNNDNVIVSPVQIPIDGMKVNPVSRN